MNDTLLNKIHCEMKLTESEVEDLNQLLQLTRLAIENTEVVFTEDKWFSIGVHFVSLVRRIRNQERLPSVDPLLIEQVSQANRLRSQMILEAFSERTAYEVEPAEFLLLALHFEAAGGK